MGPSGCGKSTLLNIIGLLDSPTSGTVTLCQTPTGKMKDSELAAFRNHNLGFVFQSFHLIPSLNVMDNVELPLIYRSGVGEKDRKRLVREVLDRVGLSHRLRHMPAQLSGGQGQRVAVARGRSHHRDGDPQRGSGAPDRPHRALLRRTPDLNLHYIT